MVGDPKQLSDLQRIEAALYARCRACGHVRHFDRQLLEEHLRNHGGVPAWSALGPALRCRCGSIDLTLKPLPYTREIVDPELREYERALIRLAVAILEEVTAACTLATAASLPLRIALHVLRPHVQHRGTLVSLWHSATTENPVSRRVGLEAGARSVRRQLRMTGRL